MTCFMPGPVKTNMMDQIIKKCFFTENADVVVNNTLNMLSHNVA